MVESLDSDLNNQITLAEFASEPKIFNAIDTNKNQGLTRTEVKAAYKKNLPIPKVKEPAPEVTALDAETRKRVSFFNREKPFALIFGTHT